METDNILIMFCHSTDELIQIFTKFVLSVSPYTDQMIVKIIIMDSVINIIIILYCCSNEVQLLRASIINNGYHLYSSHTPQSSLESFFFYFVHNYNLIIAIKLNLLGLANHYIATAALQAHTEASPTSLCMCGNQEGSMYLPCNSLFSTAPTICHRLLTICS